MGLFSAVRGIGICKTHANAPAGARKEARTGAPAQSEAIGPAAAMVASWVEFNLAAEPRNTSRGSHLGLYYILDALGLFARSRSNVSAFLANGFMSYVRTNERIWRLGVGVKKGLSLNGNSAYLLFLSAICYSENALDSACTNRL